MKSIGFEYQDFLLEPSIKSGSKFQSIRRKINQYHLETHTSDTIRNRALIHLFMVLAQLVIKKKRDTGRAEPILFNFDGDNLNDFELFSIINLVNQIQKEERVQLILFIDILDRGTTNIPDMLDGFQLPDFEIYYH